MEKVRFFDTNPDVRCSVLVQLCVCVGEKAEVFGEKYILVRTTFDCLFVWCFMGFYMRMHEGA